MKHDDGNAPYWLTDEGRRWPSDDELETEVGRTAGGGSVELSTSWVLAVLALLLLGCAWHHISWLPSGTTMVVYGFAWLRVCLPGAVVLHLLIWCSQRSRVRAWPSITVLSFLVWGLWGVADALRSKAPRGSMLTAALIALGSIGLWLVLRRIGIWQGPAVVFAANGSGKKHRSGILPTVLFALSVATVGLAELVTDAGGLGHQVGDLLGTIAREEFSWLPPRP